MATKKTNAAAAKDPAEWVTGGEPMTGPQESYLNTLAREAGAEVSDDLTKAEASERIEELRERRGAASRRRNRASGRRGRRRPDAGHAVRTARPDGYGRDEDRRRVG